MGLLDGKVAIVTGAGTGIGREYALQLAREGAKVVVNDLGCARTGEGSSTEPATNVTNEIKKAGGEAVPNFDTVAAMRGGQNILKTAIDTYGQVDILINNAGIRRDKSFAKMTEDMWDDVIATHLKGVFCVTRPVFEHMKERGGPGRIINISALGGLFGNYGQANYSAAKAGVAGFTFALSIEGRKYGITVNCLVPYALTRLTETLPAFQGAEAPVQLNPALVPPLAIFLCAKEASDVSGKIFLVRGNNVGLISVDFMNIADKPAGEGPWKPREIGQKVRNFLKEFTLKKVSELPFPSRSKG